MAYYIYLNLKTKVCLPLGKSKNLWTSSSSLWQFSKCNGSLENRFLQYIQKYFFVFERESGIFTSMPLLFCGGIYVSTTFNKFRFEEFPISGVTAKI